MKTILPLQLLVAPDLNDPQPLVIYHGRKCPDGLAPPWPPGFFTATAPNSGLDHGDIKAVEDLPRSRAGRYISTFPSRPRSCKASRSAPPSSSCLTHQERGRKAERLCLPLRRGHFDMKQVRRPARLGVFPSGRARA